MEITAVLHTHGQPEVTRDTIESVMTFMTDKVLLLIDDAGYDKFDIPALPVFSLRGFYHGFPRSPYRNICLGLLNAFQKWPDSDWYCYIEYDALVGSPTFRKDLEQAERDNVWLIGNDFRRKQEDLKKPIRLVLIETMLKTKFDEIFYLLGAVLFYHKKFVRRLVHSNFLEQFLYMTNCFQQGFFPGYVGPAAWDLIEHLMPTLAKHWGGEVQQFAKWSDKSFSWVGNNYRRYPIRWQPDLTHIEEAIQATIMHPLKTYDHPIRVFHREKRHRLMQERRKCQTSS